MDPFDPSAWGHFVRTLDPPVFWFCLIASSLIALAAISGAWYFVSRGRLLEDMPCSLIRSSAQGYIELEGRGHLLPGPPVIAPLTMRQCVWWSFKIEKRAHDGKRGTWTVVDKGVSDALFLLDDGSGHCVVDPEHAQVIVSRRDVWYGDTPRPETGPVVSRWGLFADYRYSEQRLDAGAGIYALGYFRTERGTDDGFDTTQEISELLAQWKRNRASLLARFDTNHDGEIDLAEWSEARRMARAEVLESERQRIVHPGVNVIGKPPDHRPFVLSAISQDELVRRFRRRAGLCLTGFFVFGAIAAFLFSAWPLARH